LSRRHLSCIFAGMFYSRHVFFCTNLRDDGRAACGDHGARRLRDYTKARVRELGLDAPGGVRVNMAGCLGRCGQGPVIVIYPEGVWYRYQDVRDLDEIIERHLQKGEIVERLRI
jgi:(2Fe-2S) ferredoxin